MSKKSPAENVQDAIDKKDLRLLATLTDWRVVTLDDDLEPEWETIAELWEFAREGGAPIERAMTPPEALAKRRKACPVSGGPILSNGTSAQYPQLNFANVKRRHLAKMAHGVEVARRSGKTDPQIVDLLAGHLERPSAEFQAFMESDLPVAVPASSQVVTGNNNVTIQVGMGARQVWQEKLRHLLLEEASCSDPNTQFSLRCSIAEARAELGLGG